MEDNPAKKEERSGGVSVGRNVYGNIVTGTVEGNVDYKYDQTNIAQEGLSEQQIALIRELLQPLKQKIAASDLPENKKIQAQGHAEELEKELTRQDDKPDESVIKATGKWLLDNIPDIAGTLTELFANPLVGKLVQKAGRVAADWAKERFFATPEGG